MLCQTIRGILALVLFALLLETTIARQPPAGDRVFYREKKDGTIKQVVGELKPAPTGYQVISADDKKVKATVSPADIIRVVPGDIPGFDTAAINEPVKAEDAKQWDKARLAHQEMLKKSGMASEKVRKYLEFRVAIAAARSADDAADENAGQAKAAEAVKFLDGFLTAYKTGWEVWPAVQACARLQVALVEQTKAEDKVSERRMFAEAARTWGRASRAADLPPDMRLDATLQEIDNKIRARQFADARGLIDEAAKTAPAGPIKDRLAIYQLTLKFADTVNPADGAALIEAEIAKTKDPSVRATGYGMLGELYLAADKPRDAMWAFLWVEVVYNQDKDEVIKALVRLADVFRLQGDDDRAKSYRDKLRRYRGAA